MSIQPFWRPPLREVAWTLPDRVPPRGMTRWPSLYAVGAMRIPDAPIIHWTIRSGSRYFAGQGIRGRVYARGPGFGEVIMGPHSSYLTMIVIAAGTTGLMLAIRLLGKFAEKTHDKATGIASPPPPQPIPLAPAVSTASAGMEPGVLMAIIAAAVAAELGTDKVLLDSIHEVNIPSSSHDWGMHGRHMIFDSHRLRS